MSKMVFPTQEQRLIMHDKAFRKLNEDYDALRKKYADLHEIELEEATIEHQANVIAIMEKVPQRVWVEAFAKGQYIRNEEGAHFLDDPDELYAENRRYGVVINDLTKKYGFIEYSCYQNSPVSSTGQIIIRKLDNLMLNGYSSEESLQDYVLEMFLEIDTALSKYEREVRKKLGLEI